MQGDHTVTVDGDVEFSEDQVESDSGTFEIYVDGALFATIVFNDDTVTVQSGTGHELTAAEIEAVRSIFDGLDVLFDETFEDFLRPVEWMFDR
jgi:hypothetical protein